MISWNWINKKCLPCPHYFYKGGGGVGDLGVCKLQIDAYMGVNELSFEPPVDCPYYLEHLMKVEDDK